jgi:ribosome biogenesis GTPase / thiamine phosphate phosphatase
MNELVRPPISNIDQAILVFSTKNPDFSHHLLDRFLVMIESKRIEPIIVFTKKDLLTEAERVDMEKYIEDYRSLGYQTLFVSAKFKEGISELYPLISGKVSVIAGQSGVGKSTLLNALRPDLKLETKEISKHLGRGRHTTRHVELLEIEGGYVADTPGFSSLDFIDIEMEDLSFYFPEMRKRLNDCKFRGCLHDKEPQCAIKSAVNEGEIAHYRYENYLSFLNEIRNRKPRY